MLLLNRTSRLRTRDPRFRLLSQGKVEIRPVMYIALTYDHRLIDGREAVTFLATVRDRIEDPRKMLLGL